jgi:7,8-dihydropterin-6-yl-methyl-4-(beta-D-ribofuranosyl)aminobenzene 5'-phosphate synthase
MKNLHSLGIDLSRIDALALSHGHFDHWAALPAILERGRPAVRRGTPFYVGREAFLRRFARPAGQGDPVDLGVLDRDSLSATGEVRIVEIVKPTEVVPGAYTTGHINRVTSYEHVSAGFMVERDGRLEQDRFEGEQALVFAVKGKGLVVLSGCAHAGIVNSTLRARELTGIEDIHALIGGFHLVGAPVETIEATVADVRAFSPDYVVPTHCTGFEATARFREAMPDQFLLNTAGTTYTFGG